MTNLGSPLEKKVDVVRINLDKQEVLFQLIKERKRLGHSGKYILFIGAGASLSSGASLFSEIFRSLSVKDYDEFSSTFDSLSESERYALLHDHLLTSSPSKAAKRLAHLLKEGYFDIVITTNFDNLIERSLQDVGLTSSDFEVVVNSPDNPVLDLDKILSYRSPRIKILKLHGDFIKRKFAITKRETIQFKSPLETELKRLLSLNDSIIVGSAFADLDLLRTVEMDGGSIWYINPNEPEDYLKALMSHRKCDGNFVSGDNGKFDVFIENLYTFLTGTTERTFKGEWVVLAPFCPVIPFENSNFNISEASEHHQLSDRTIIEFKSMDLNGQRLSLHWLNIGIAVWVLKIPVEFESIYSFAFERKMLYRQILREEHIISKLTTEIRSLLDLPNDLGDCISELGYCFSLVNVTAPAWEGQQISNALKLLSCPSMFYDRYVDSELLLELSANAMENLAGAEQEFLSKGIMQEDLCSFKVDRKVNGFASWAGLAMLGLNESGTSQFDDILNYEVDLQAHWWYFHHFKNLIIEGFEDFVTDRYKSDKINRSFSKLVSIGPTETTASRLYKEAIIKTSRIKNHYKDFKELL